jgi:hypothetical protein
VVGAADQPPAPALPDPLGLAHVREGWAASSTQVRSRTGAAERGAGDAADDPPFPSPLGGLRRTARASLCEVSSEVAEEVVLTVDEAATNAILYGSGDGQPVEVAVAVTADWIEATVLDHGPALPPSSRLAGATPRR